MITFDVSAFYRDLDAIRAHKGISWRTMAAEAGVLPSSLTRMGQGKQPSVTTAARLLAWSRLQFERYIIISPGRGAEEGE